MLQLHETSVDQAMDFARRLVAEAEAASAALGRLPANVDRKPELLKANAAVAEARGGIIMMRLLFPDNLVLAQLWRRIIHCPVVMLVGPDVANEQQPVQLAQ